MKEEIVLIILQALLAIIGVLVTRWLVPTMQAYIGAERLATIAHLAHEAFAWVEAQAPELGIKGREKLQMALEYLAARLAERGINITADQMRAAIETVWLQYQLSE